MRLYAAYGSNLNKEQMRMRCPDSEPVYTGFIRDHKLAYSGHGGPGYLTIEKSKGNLVPVVVWKISDSDEKRLDIYEGYPKFYEKKYVDVYYDGDIKVVGKVFVYYQQLEMYKIPTESYVMTCIQGYKDFNLPLDYLDNAYTYTRLREGKMYVEDN